MAHTAGFIVGALIGMLFIGGIAGWIIKRIFKPSWAIADGIGLLLVAFGGAATASTGTIQSYFEYAAIYLVAALPAFFILQRLRADATDALPHTTKSQRPPIKWKRPTGIVLIVLLGSIGATAMFSAFRSMTVGYAGSPEMSFFIGTLLLIPCIFIYRHMVR